MKKVNDILEGLITFILIIVVIGGHVFLIYKLFSGIYTLLDKLIDKI